MSLLNDIKESNTFPNISNQQQRIVLMMPIYDRTRLFKLT